MDNKLKIGDIVTVTEEGYASGKVGIVGAEVLAALENYRVTYRIPVRFPKFVADRWFFEHEVNPASEHQCKQYFLQVLKHGR